MNFDILNTSHELENIVDSTVSLSVQDFRSAQGNQGMEQTGDSKKIRLPTNRQQHLTQTKPKVNLTQYTENEILDSPFGHKSASRSHASSIVQLIKQFKNNSEGKKFNLKMDNYDSKKHNPMEEVETVNDPVSIRQSRLSDY